jgi:phenylalanine-4-hydroxylase
MATSGCSAAPALVQLDADHPGFHDLVYRRRRNEIARIATEYDENDPVPDVAYTEEEQSVWREVWRHLAPLHERYACSAYQGAAEKVALSRERIPQLREVNARIQPMHGFRMLPVAGLVTAEAFLTRLHSGIFLSTQYMRHHSVPLYTPEPDVVHELIGHAATFADSTFAEINRAFGRAADRATSAGAIEAIGRVYWFTLEFGVLEEAGALKVCGAGLLSSFGELGRFESQESLCPWDISQIAATPYDPTNYQDVLFVAPSFARMRSDLLQWLSTF